MSKTNPTLKLQLILQGREMSIWFISLEANLTPVKTEYLFKLHEKVGVASSWMSYHGASTSSVSQRTKSHRPDS